ncbi:BTAD domain-containing putative transcriptional regulator [Streptomyces sp. NPDC057838]|uniref:BTAD domain-containing putative transcriptional regulator n=1 Tax=unclassified Streptomyces TaxID=2593676 RepID=UPI003675EB9A
MLPLDNVVHKAAEPITPSIEAFGHMRFRIGQQEVALGSPRQRALFAVLLISIGKTVPVHDIISALWGPAPPSAVMGTLHSYVSRLRKAISDVIPTQHEILVSMRHATPGYQLEMSPEDTDVHRFESLVASGRTHFSAGDLARARSDLDRAMALWTDTPYSELASYDFAALEATRLDQLRLQALQIWADACLNLGAHDEVVRELSKEIRRNPMLERLGSQLMLAQYHSGSPAEALMTYERIRSHVSAELGADTSKELQEIHQAILRQDLPATLPQPLRESRPAVITTRPAHTVPTPPPPVTTSAPARPRALRGAPPIGSLIGRDQEMEQLRSMVMGDFPRRTVLITGEQGIGKTRLLRELEQELKAADAEVVWAHCTGGGEPSRRTWGQVVQKVLRLRGHLLRDPAATAVPGTLHRHEHHRPRDGDFGPADLDDMAYQQAVMHLLLSAAADKPLVIMLEDLHLADTPTLELLRLLTMEAHEARLMVLATVQEHSLTCRPDLRRATADLLRADSVGNLHLTALSPVEAHALIHEVHHAPVPWHHVSFLHRATGGNPYLLTALARHEDLSDVHRDLLASLSFDVRTVLRSRLTEHPPEVIAVLEVCAVMGPVIDHYLLTSVLEQRGMTGTVKGALETGLLTRNPADAGDLRFSQYLIRDYLLEGLDAVLKAQLHLSIAQALADRTAHHSRSVVGPDLTHHCTQAAVALDPHEAVRPMIAMADRAELLKRWGEVVMWLAQASAVLRSRPRSSEAAHADRALQNRLARVRTICLRCMANKPCSRADTGAGMLRRDVPGSCYTPRPAAKIKTSLQKT